MKIAYLISAHKDPAQLHRMIKALDDEEAYFFVHIDAKADMSKFIVPGNYPPRNVK